MRSITMAKEIKAYLYIIFLEPEVSGLRWFGLFIYMSNHLPFVGDK